MDGQPTRPLVYSGSYTACCEGGAGFSTSLSLNIMDLPRFERVQRVEKSFALEKIHAES